MNNNSNINNYSDITLLSDITKDSYNCFFNNTFVIFKAINNCFYLVYSSKDYSIICYDFYNQKKISEIKQINKETYTSFRHYYDDNSKRDFILTITTMSANLRLWDARNWSCFLYINRIYNYSVLYSACFLNYKNKIYLVTSSCNYFGDSELIKIFDLNGYKIKEIKNSNDATLLIDIYYDKKNIKTFIITANKNYLKSFDYDKNIIYKKYYDNYTGAHFCFIIDDNKDIIKLIDSCEDGNIRIWNFDTGILLNKIKICKDCLYEICFLNENQLLICSQDKEIKLLDLTSNKIIKTLHGHKNYVISIKKIMHKYYGECLLSHGFENDQIKIWKLKS